MELNTVHREVTSNFSGEDIRFRIDTDTSVIFDILRNKLYSDKPASICRELLSNARDAHREVGKDSVPIRITVPGPYLVIQDFGPGISPARMEEIYCIYGRSTKREDNIQTGGYGLGAKTPFSLVDSFTVITVVNGTKYDYVCYIDESNCGKIRLINEESTDEENGTTIKVPVSPHDRNKFVEKLYYYTQFWEPQPRFLGQLPRETFKFTVTGTNWALVTKKYTGNCNVLVDGIPYHTTGNSLSGVVFLFKTGEVDISASREEIEYTKKTINAIRRAKENYNTEISTAIVDQIEAAETFDEVITILNMCPSLTRHEWNWRGNKFTYPLENNISSYHIGYGNRICSSYLDSLDEKNLFFLRQDKPEFTPFDKRRIRQFLDDNNAKRVYILPDSVTLPVTTTPLSTVKVRVHRNSNPKKRNHIKVWDSHKSKFFGKISIDRTGPTLYTTKEWKTFGLEHHICRVQEKDVKYIKDAPNWQNLDDYFQVKLYDKYNREEIQRFAEIIQTCADNENLKFLSKDIPDLNCFLEKEKIDTTIKQIIWYLIKNHVLEVKRNSVIEKYPMLKFVDSYDTDDTTNQKIIRNYVKGTNNES
jgi:hypothetical protein